MNPLIGNRRFLALSAAQLLASFGNWILYLAILVLIAIRWHHGPLAVAFGMVSLVLPSLVVGPYAGILADRRDRRILMIASNVLSTVAVASLLFVHDLWQLYVALMCLGVVDTFFSPAEEGMLKEVVPDDHMGQAMSVRNIIAQGTKIVGPGLSGVLVAAFGPRIPFAIDAVCFLASAVIVTFVHGGRAHIKKTASAESKSGYGAGFRFLWDRRVIRILVGFFGLMLLVLQMMDSQVVILLRHVDDASRILGFAMSASGVGMVAGAVLVGKSKTRRPLGWMAIGMTIMGIGFSGVALMVKGGTAWAVPMVFVAVGVAASGAIIPFQTKLQQDVPIDWTGRVMASVSVVSSAAVVIGPIFGGFAVDSLGIIPTFLIAGSVLAVLGLIAGVVTWTLRRDTDAQGQSGLQTGAQDSTGRGG